MANLETQKLEDILRDRIGRFVDNKSKWRLHRHKILQEICGYDNNAFLCGGAARDVLLSQNYKPIIPRDLDIILECADLNKVADSFAGHVKRWNSYGGLSIQIQDWSVDLWLLSETWAAKEKIVEVNSFVDFPKTTFLDIDAVAVQLFKRKGQKRKIHAKGFFEAILKKTIEINLEDNPNPAMCIVRSLRIANKFRFAIGPKLARYIAHYANQIELEEILGLYRTRYQPTVSFIEEIGCYIETIKKQIRVSNKQPVKLPVSENKVYFHSTCWNSSLQKNARCLFSTE